MNEILLLIKPRLWTFKNQGKGARRWIKIGLFTLVGFLLWAGIYAASHRVLSYIKGIEDIGHILAFKLLSMVLLTFFSLLIFSSFLTSLSKLFLSKDLNLVHALPVSREKVFLARWIESTLDSSWMVIIYSFPVFLAFGIIFKAGPLYYVNMSLLIFPLCIIASGLSAFIVLITVILLPAGKLRSIFVFLGLLVFVIFYIAFRLLKPERLVDPEAFASALLYLQSLRAPASPFIPSTWIF